MSVYDVGRAVIDDILPREPSGRFGPTASEACGLTGQAKPIVTVGAEWPFEARLVPMLYATAVQGVNSAELRIYNPDIVAGTSERQSLTLEEDPSHRSRGRLIPGWYQEYVQNGSPSLRGPLHPTPMA